MAHLPFLLFICSEGEGLHGLVSLFSWRHNEQDRVNDFKRNYCQPFEHLLFYTSSFEFLILCFLHLKGFLENFLQSDRWMPLPGLPLLCISASPPSSGKNKIHGWSLPTFTAANLKVCSSDFPVEVFTIRCYNACLSIMMYKVFVLCFLHLCMEVFLFSL